MNKIEKKIDFSSHIRYLWIPPNIKKKEKPMTQLIATICDSGKTVVTASDRMVGTGDMSLTFEHGEPKAQTIASNAVLLTAGTMHEPDLVIDARKRAKGKERIRDIADILKELYQELRIQHIEDEVLRRLAGLKSFKDYHDKQKELHDGIVMELNQRIAGYDLDLSLILAGVDEQAHIIEIGNPGTWRSSDAVGYCTVGMGSRHADNVFAWYRYSTNISLQDAVYIAFEAKKKAEMAGGVGQLTDILVIDKKSTKILKPNVINDLEETYNERENKQKRGVLDRNITKLDIQTDSFESS